MRFSSCAFASACLLSATVSNAASIFQFADATKVNLLERWNTNGSYGLSTTTTGSGSPIRAIDFAEGGQGYVENNPALVTIRYTFDAPKVIDKVTLDWRGGHAPDNYTFSDQNGAFASDPAGGGFIAAGLITHNTFGSRTSNYIELNVNPGATATNVFELSQLGAYLAAGETLDIDGTYNILYNETPTATDSNGGGNDVARWTDLTNLAVSPIGVNPSFVQYEFANAYEFYGMYLNFQFNGNANASLEGASVEVSQTGLPGSYTTILTPGTISARGYVPFSATGPKGSFLRLNWTGDTTPGLSEISEIQLFGAIPEPSTALLAGVGAFLVAARRRVTKRA